MTAVLFLLAGLVVGVAVCGLVVLLAAKVWPGQWRNALTYFGLGDDPEAEIVESTGRELREAGSFAWPRSPRPRARR
jgi:Na+/H+-translocating membrane pyrophosphatase